MDSRADTIAAVATAPGRAGVAVVRVSGPDAFVVGEKVSGRAPEPGRVLFARFCLPAPGGERPVRSPSIDSGLLVSFKSPRSYTGEDVVEFQCHGGAVAPRRVLEACFAAGARLARRGEFTERAFLNGKLTYEQAEATLDLIDAKTDRAADAAFAELEGDGRARTPGGASPVRDLYNQALDISSTVEHSLDIDEGELQPSFFDSLAASLASLADGVRAAMRRLRERRLLREGALVVLAGPPNAGKSSLMNALLGESRAIVSATPGTTRDSIEEWLDVGGWPVRIVDTAGIRESDDEIESEGVRRAESLMAKADLVLMLEPAGGDERLGTRDAATGDKRQLAVAATCDISTSRRAAELPNCPTSIRLSSKCDIARGPGLNVSAVTGEGLDALRAEIAARLEALADAPGTPADESPASRQMSVFLEAESILNNYTSAKPPNHLTAEPPNHQTASPDLVLLANDLRMVCEKLGSLVGAVYSDDLLGRLFSRFCVGK